MTNQSAHEQFIAYYQESKGKVFSYLMYRSNFNRVVCEDLLMDIALKAYENFDQFEPKKGSFKSWIFRITHNHLINSWRGNRAVDSLEKMEEEGVSMPSVEVNEGVSNEIYANQIEHVLSLLSEKEKEVITLKYLNEFSYEEIANITNNNQGTIRTSLSRALSKFKSIYSKLYE